LPNEVAGLGGVPPATSAFGQEQTADNSPKSRRWEGSSLATDKTELQRQNVHRILSVPRMTAIYSRKYCSILAETQAERAIQPEAISCVYGTSPAYTAVTPSTSRWAQRQ
jgi:hypothetical protein